MTKLIDKICKVRDLVTSKDYGKLKFYNMEIMKLKEENYKLKTSSTKQSRVSNEIIKSL